MLCSMYLLSTYPKHFSPFLLILLLRFVHYIGPGQLEVVLRYRNNPMKLADNVIYVKETISCVAKKYSFKALFIPKYDMTKAGNGLHIHMSFRDKTTRQGLFSNRNETIDSDGGSGSGIGNGLSKKGSAFIEGILQHLPSIMGITLPTRNSFKRIGVGCWTGSEIGWAVEDKECGIRVCSNLQTKEWDHVECKLSDSTCNIYMAITALLACGLHGIKQNLILRPSISDQKQDQNQDSVVVQSLPSTVEEAFVQLEQDTLLCETFGSTLMTGYLALRRNEAERASKMTLEDEVKEAFDRA